MSEALVCVRCDGTFDFASGHDCPVDREWSVAPYWAEDASGSPSKKG